MQERELEKGADRTEDRTTDNLPVFFHVDLDAFFASVEQREHPQYKGKPVIIGKVAPRSVVSTCSYEARKYGIHSAMPTVQAFRLCPHGIFLEGNYELYSKVSRQVMEILREYAPEIHQVSIDEAWMDMTGTRRLWGKPKALALKIKDRIKNETGITVSIGIAPSPFIAKMASDFNKPDGLCLVSPGKEQLFIDTIGLGKIWGIGKSTLAALNSNGLFTPAQVRNVPPERLCRITGKAMADYIQKACRGLDPGIRDNPIPEKQSISTETTFDRNITEIETLNCILSGMARELIARSIEREITGTTVALKLRWADFRTETVQKTFEDGVKDSLTLYRCAEQLLRQKWKKDGEIRLIGLGLHNTHADSEPVQSSLFEEEESKKRKLDRVAYELDSKGSKLRKASELERNYLIKTASP